MLVLFARTAEIVAELLIIQLVLRRAIIHRELIDADQYVNADWVIVHVAESKG